jgi:hypothetical protein
MTGRGVDGPAACKPLKPKTRRKPSVASRHQGHLQALVTTGSPMNLSSCDMAATKPPKPGKFQSGTPSDLKAFNRQILLLIISRFDLPYGKFDKKIS